MGFQKKISKRCRLSAGTVKQKRKFKRRLTSQRSVTSEMALNGGGASGNRGDGSSGSGGGVRATSGGGPSGGAVEERGAGR